LLWKNFSVINQPNPVQTCDNLVDYDDTCDSRDRSALLRRHIPYKDLKARADAACNTISELIENGLTIEVTDEDREVAATIATAYAKDPEQTSKKITNKRVGQLRPASLVLVGNILDEFGQSVVESANHIRHLVTNKLLLETENPDPRIRLRALELLGKISDVSLFAEKTEVTVTHRSTDELRDVLTV
jgi:hypothetical protein